MSPPVALATKRRSDRAARDVGAIAAVLAVLLVALALQPLLDGPGFVPRITFANPSPYDLTVEAAADPADGWVTVGSVRRRAETTVEQVLDVGDRWTFRFSTGDTEGGTLAFDRQALDAAKWRVEIPSHVEQRLRTSGVPVSP